MIAKESTLNQSSQLKQEDISDDDDSETEKSYFHDSAYHKYFKKKKDQVQVQTHQHQQQFYIANRPGSKISNLNEREKKKSKLYLQANLSISNNTKVDKFLTDYFEQTKGNEGVTLDLEMFKKIAFSSGMPLIIVDLMIYLFGGYNSTFVS